MCVEDPISQIWSHIMVTNIHTTISTSVSIMSQDGADKCYSLGHWYIMDTQSIELPIAGVQKAHSK